MMLLRKNLTMIKMFKQKENKDSIYNNLQIKEFYNQKQSFQPYPLRNLKNLLKT